MKIDRSKKRVFGKRFIFVSLVILSCFLTIYVYSKQEQDRKLFENLSVTFKDKPTIEYGTSSIDVEKFVKGSYGKVRITKGNLDSMQIGTQEVVLQVTKNGIERNFSFKVEVKDTKAPEIKVEQDRVYLQVGDSFDPARNILSVHDLVDGNLEYVPAENVGENHKNYYTYTTNLNTAVAGEYLVEVRAMDKHQNTSSYTFTIQVDKPAMPVESGNASVSTFDINTLNISSLADGSKTGIIQVAHALLGFPYVLGGNSPSGFDCSGFVHYVFAQNGMIVPRTTGGQTQVGIGISLAEAMPGDILVFSTNAYGGPTHSAIYIGGGNMIHAANPRKGVIVSNVSAYVSYGNHIIAVRRV